MAATPLKTLRTAAAARRRAFAVASLRYSVVSVAIAAGIDAAVVVGARMALLPVGAEVLGSMLIAVPIAAIGLAIGLAWFRRWSVPGAALELDHRLRLKDRLSTAISLGESSARVAGPFAAVAIEDAERLAEQVRVTAAVPAALGRWPVIAAAAAGLCVAVWFLPQKSIRSAASAPPIAVQEARRTVEDAAATVRDAVQEAPLDEARAAAARRSLDQLDEITRELSEGSASRPPEEALAESSRAINDVAQQIETKSEQQVEQVREARRRLAEAARAQTQAAPTGSSTADDLRRALREGDVEAARSAAESLAREMQSLTPEQREGLAQELERIASELEKQDANTPSGTRETESQAGSNGDLPPPRDQKANEANDASKTAPNRSTESGHDRNSPAPSPARPNETANPQDPSRDQKPTAPKDAPQPSDGAQSQKGRSGSSESKDQPANRATDQPKQRGADSKESRPDQAREQPSKQQPSGRPPTQPQETPSKPSPQDDAPKGDSAKNEASKTGTQTPRKPGPTQDDGTKQGQPSSNSQETQQQPSPASTSGQQAPDRSRPAAEQGPSNEPTPSDRAQSGSQSQPKGPAAGTKQPENTREAKQGSEQHGMSEAMREAARDLKEKPKSPESPGSSQEPAADSKPSNAENPDSSSSNHQNTPGPQENATPGQQQLEPKQLEQKAGGGPDSSKPESSQGKSDALPDAKGIERLAREFQKLDERQKDALRQQAASQDLRKRAEELLRQASPAQRRELEKLSREMSNEAGGNQPEQQGDKSPRETPSGRDGRSSSGDDPSGPRTGSTRADRKPFEDDPRAKLDVRRSADDANSAQPIGRVPQVLGDAPIKSSPVGVSPQAAQSAARGVERALEQQAIPPRHSDLIRRIFRRIADRASAAPQPAKDSAPAPVPDAIDAPAR